MLRPLAALACLAIASTPALARTVTVQPGDSLSAIAQRELGDAGRWPDICKANRKLLGENCDRLIVGGEIEIPGVPEAPVQEKAVEEAAPEGIQLRGELVQLVPEEVTPRTDNSAFGIETRPDGGLVLFGNVTDARPGGRTGGLFFPIPHDVAVQFRGHVIRIDALVSAEAGTGYFRMAYSTAGAGNSGWKTLTASEGRFDIASFTYEVPAARTGSSDFIGVLPDPDGTGNRLAIRAFSVMILH